MRFENRIKEVEQLNQKIDTFRPLSASALPQIKEYFRIGLTYSSNALEGNTLTETETKIVLEEGLTVAGKPLKDHFEASGHSDAYDLVCKLASKKSVTESDILSIHQLFYFRIDSVNAGKYRQVPVIITGTTYESPPSAEIPNLMKKFIRKIPALRKKHDPITACCLIHKELVDIHPFVDGNGRTARLLMNLILMQNAYVPVVIPPIFRSEYLTFVKNAQIHRNMTDDFVRFISSMSYESTKDYLRLLKHLSR